MALSQFGLDENLSRVENEIETILLKIMEANENELYIEFK